MSISTGDDDETMGAIPAVPAGTGPVDPASPAAAVSGGDRAGALVVSVVPASPAQDAGLRADDVITALDGRQVGGMADLILALRAHRPGDRAQLSLVRGGDASQATVHLGPLPQATG